MFLSGKTTIIIIMKKNVKFVLIIIAALLVVSYFCLFNKKESITIGVDTGTVFDEILLKDNPNAEISYFNSSTDMPIALETGKIDAYGADEPIAKAFINEYPNHYISKKLSSDNYGIIVNKENELLLQQLNEYIDSLTASGKLQQMKDIWFGNDESKKIVDFASIENNEPVLNFITISASQPFEYIKDGKFAGYEIDLVVSFCREYGYGLQIEDGNFASLLVSVSSGKSDFGGATISITEQRKESVNFTNPICEGGLVYVEKRKADTNVITSLDDLANKEIGLQTGSTYSMYLKNCVVNPKEQYFSLLFDMAAALDSNKIYGFVVDKPVAELFVSENKGKYKILAPIADVSFGVVIPKVNHNDKLYQQFDEYIKKVKADGTLQKKYDIWVGDDEEKKVVDKTLTGKNGTLSFASSSAVGAPSAYMKNGDVIGFDIDLAYSFAREYGYNIDYQDYSMDGVLAAVSTGKCDFASCMIAVTEERKQAIAFPESYLDSQCVIVVKNQDGQIDQQEKESFIESIISSFDKTFIKESRYKLFLSGIKETIIITILAIIIGTIVGLLVYILYRNSTRFFQIIIDGIRNVLSKTPVVVILMILYYIIFQDAQIKSRGVSIIGLSLLFANSVTDLIAMGVNSIDKGQMEAAYALGYSYNEAFMRIILPQAILVVVSAYKGSIISMIKDSSIVGYIAVQDLTKVSDIVRSRTYQAFFPLIASAIIYYLIATIFIFIVSKVEFVIDPKKRKVIPALKGVKKDDRN